MQYTLQVYHDAAPDFRVKPEGQRIEARHVAHLTVEATDALDAMEKAYRLTNSIEKYWGDDPKAGAIGQRHRSTSVGDFIFVQDDQLYVCASVGWQPSTHVLEFI